LFWELNISIIEIFQYSTLHTITVLHTYIMDLGTVFMYHCV